MNANTALWIILALVYIIAILGNVGVYANREFLTALRAQYVMRFAGAAFVMIAFSFVDMGFWVYFSWIMNDWRYVIIMLAPLLSGAFTKLVTRGEPPQPSAVIKGDPGDVLRAGKKDYVLRSVWTGNPAGVKLEFTERTR